VDLLRVEPYPYTEICCGRNEVTNIKVEHVTDVQEDKHQLVKLLPVIKAEQEVCPCIQCYTRSRHTQIDSCFSYMSVPNHMKYMNSFEWVLKNYSHNISGGFNFVEYYVQSVPVTF
jgi:hypothetical protein